VSLKKQALIGVKWTTTASIINSVVQLIQLAILARILDPVDFGLMSLVMVAIGFSQLFVDMGVSNAIIYKQGISTEKLSSLYWLNIIIGFLFFWLLILFSPYISKFYENEQLVPLINIVAVTFVIKPWGQQFMVLLQKNMHFNDIAKTDIVSRLISFVVVVVLAYKNFGVYSLAYGTIIYSAFSTIGYIFYGYKIHKPRLHFKINDLKDFISFGLFQMGEKTLHYFSTQFDTILIGKLLGIEILGVYNIAKNLVIKPSSIINPVIIKVTFPLMSKINNDLERVKTIFLKILNIVSYINIPVYLMMAFFAGPIVVILFGKEWIDAIPIVQILSFTFLLRALNSPSGSLLLSQGKANVAFYWKLAVFGLYPLSIIIGSHWGIIGITIAILILQIILFFPNWKFIVFKTCKANFLEYSRSIFVPFIFAFISIFISKILTFNISNMFIELLLASIIFMSIFILLIYKYNHSLFVEIKSFFHFPKL